VVSTKAFLRARRPEHKRQRYEAILDAAGELAVQNGVGAVSLADIASRVGMHKSALLKYFGPREEIFLRLSEGEWQEWAAAVTVELDGGDAATGRVPEILARSVAQRPLFCQLLIYSPRARRWRWRARTSPATSRLRWSGSSASTSRGSARPVTSDRARHGRHRTS